MDDATAKSQLETIRADLEGGTISAEVAMQRLVALMRERSDVPGAKELYQEASRRAYDNRRSSPAYSHPPPPVGPDDEPAD